MGQQNSKVQQLASSRTDRRTRLKGCFSSKIFLSFVPYEIWQFIVTVLDLRSASILLQTCSAFKDLVERAFQNYLEAAISFRREGQMKLAIKSLNSCVSNNSVAMFRLAISYWHGGFGVEEDHILSAEWFKKSADEGYGPAMAFYSFFLFWGHGVEKNEQLSHIWARKAFQSEDPLAMGCFYTWGLDKSSEYEKSLSYFKTSAEDGDEIAQVFYGSSFQHGNVYGNETDHQKAYYWYRKAGEQGLACGQYYVGDMLRKGNGCEEDKEESLLWFTKAAKQGNAYAKIEVENMNKE